MNQLKMERRIGDRKCTVTVDTCVSCGDQHIVVTGDNIDTQEFLLAPEEPVYRFVEAIFSDWADDDAKVNGPHKVRRLSGHDA